MYLHEHSHDYTEILSPMMCLHNCHPLVSSAAFVCRNFWGERCLLTDGRGRNRIGERMRNGTVPPKPQPVGIAKNVFSIRVPSPGCKPLGVHTTALLSHYMEAALDRVWPPLGYLCAIEGLIAARWPFPLHLHQMSFLVERSL